MITARRPLTIATIRIAIHRFKNFLGMEVLSIWSAVSNLSRGWSKKEGPPVGEKKLGTNSRDQSRMGPAADVIVRVCAG